MNIARILVPVDYSSCSRVALRFAAELGRPFGASLDVVHVWDRPSYVSDVVLTRSDPLSPKSLIVLIEENARRDLDEFLTSAELPAGTALVSRLAAGDPASALLHELKVGSYDLAVIGTHGRTGLSHILLGSVAEKLVRLSPVPVLTVPDESARSRRG
jgi:nucleotide-binding universal stress UspA family protein